MTRNPTVGLRYVGNQRKRKCEMGSTGGLEQEKDSNCLYKQAQRLGQDQMKAYEGNQCTSTSF